MPPSDFETSVALHQSLISSPLLIGDLPEAEIFPHEILTLPEDPPRLNFAQKLGHLYEDALTNLLKNSPRYHLLHQGLQLREKAGHTLGELDYLLRERSTQQLIHLELAVKFYLAVETQNALLLPGPDARDNYFRKMEKMRTHQLVLTQKFPHLLPAEYHTERIKTQHLVYGCIFEHVNATKYLQIEHLSTQRRRGLWLRASECTEIFPEKTCYRFVPKQLWPVPFELLDNENLAKWKPTPAMDRCTMVRIDGSNTPYFIAPDDYGYSLFR